jgi:hypothetical protein
MRHCKKRWRYLYLECTDFTIYLGAETVQHAERELLVVMRIWMRISVLRLRSGRCAAGVAKITTSCLPGASLIGPDKADSGRSITRAAESDRIRVGDRFMDALLSFYFHSTCVFCPLQAGHLASSHAVPSPPRERRGGRERGAIPAFPRHCPTPGINLL